MEYCAWLVMQSAIFDCAQSAISHLPKYGIWSD